MGSWFRLIEAKVCTSFGLNVTPVRLTVTAVILNISQVSLNNASVTCLRLAVDDGNSIKIQLISPQSAVFILSL